MQRLLSKNLWREVARLARSSKTRRAAIAYITTDEFVEFGKGDSLIVEASESVIASGGTSARVLLNAHRRGAAVYHCQGLHGKVLLFDDVAVIGSANLSQYSATALIEAAVMTDHPPTLSSVTAFLNQLSEQSVQLTEDSLKQLLKIKVVRSNWGIRAQSTARIDLADQRTWLVGVREIDEGRYAEDFAKAEVEEREAAKLKKTKRNVVSWIRWVGRGRFRKEARPGDTIIQMWRPKGEKLPSLVYRRASILSRVDDEKSTRFYVEESSNADATTIKWTPFQSLLRKAGYEPNIGPNVERLFDEDVADRIFSLWADRKPHS